MYNLLVKLTSNWTQAGERHATKQRIRTIQEFCNEITYAADHFGRTLTWILDILDMFSKPFDNLPMNKRISIVAWAICNGNINYDGNGKTGVVHFQYAQMNNTISMWMTKSTSRAALRTMITTLCDPSNKGRRDPTKAVSVQQVDKGTAMLGADFTTTIATVKSLAEYYKDYKGPPCFWETPPPTSNSRSAFANMRTDAQKRAPTKKPIIVSWEDELSLQIPCSIPELIEQLVSGKKIYIPENYENGIIGHTTINPDYLIYKPVPKKGALMWSFLGNSKGFTSKRSYENASPTTWNRLIAIHYIHIGAHKNYILITDKSYELPQYISNNPVLGEWNLASSVSRHLGPVFTKLRNSTTIRKPPGYGLSMGHPMIGIGVCKSPSGCLVGGNITFRMEQYGIGTIKYFEKQEAVNISHSKYCANCSAPRGVVKKPFCGNCGSKF
jgi:hypothetical protein